tara:strand:- start:68827 stop:69273 length:447 start_codon:yes stop_codon:yes gene_type:complete
MTDEFKELLIDYVESLSLKDKFGTSLNSNDSYLTNRDFILLTKSNTIMYALFKSKEVPNLSFGRADYGLKEYGCEYSIKMISNIRKMLNDSNKKYVNMFNYILNKILDYYSQTVMTNSGNNLFKLSKDGLEFLNMINNDNIPFLDDIY